MLPGIGSGGRSSRRIESSAQLGDKGHLVIQSAVRQIHCSMLFPSPLLPGTLRQRYKRFLADVELDSQEQVVAHCANPGSMRSCLVPGGRVWLSRSPRLQRKLAYTWEIAEVESTRVFVNPAAANQVVGEALQQKRITSLHNYSEIRREVRTGGGSRIDFLLSRSGKRCWVEVKNVTLSLGGGRTAFPDAVTARGRRHLEELSELKAAGDRAVMLFCVARGDAQSLEPADAIDPAYGAALRKAASAGVELLAYRCSVTLEGVSLEQELPIGL